MPIRLLWRRRRGAPMGTPIRITEENFWRIPRVYIECLRDKASVRRYRSKCISRCRVRGSYPWTLTTRHSSLRQRSWWPV